LALERRDEWSETPLVGAEGPSLPPEPFRYVGGHVVRAAVARKERAEDAGRQATAFDRFLASLAPAGLTARTTENKV
jgi:hypothetical protein